MTRTRTDQPPNDQPDQLPVEWQQRAREAARQFKIPMPTEEDLGSRDEAEQHLRDYGQEGGQ